MTPDPSGDCSATLIGTRQGEGPPRGAECQDEEISDGSTRPKGDQQSNLSRSGFAVLGAFSK